MAGLEELEKAINRFEEAQKNLREEVRLAHQATKEAIQARKALERHAQSAIEALDRKIEEYVQKELSQLGEKATEASNHIYDKVGEQIDILIGLSLGEKLSRSKNKVDIRPALAAKLREWIQDELEKNT